MDSCHVAPGIQRIFGSLARFCAQESDADRLLVRIDGDSGCASVCFCLLQFYRVVLPALLSFSKELWALDGHGFVAVSLKASMGIVSFSSVIFTWVRIMVGEDGFRSVTLIVFKHNMRI